MTTEIIFGKKVNVLEHMAEIKEVSDQFGRFYNKKQMFKAFLGKDVFIDKAEHINAVNDIETFNQQQYDPYFGDAVGARTVCGVDDVSIVFYRVEDLLEEEKENIFSAVDWGSFFVKDDNGQIYFVYVNED